MQTFCARCKKKIKGFGKSGLCNSCVMTGKKLSKEHKRKIGEKSKGRKHSQETIEKIRAFHLGRKLSEEHRKKIGEKSRGTHRTLEVRKKMSISHKGKRNSRWKGGITPIIEQIRKCFEYRQWRSDIFTRDDYTCVLCGKRGGTIQADHFPKRFFTIFHDNKINSLQEALNCEEFWNINNGRTVCVDCHRKTFTWK